jgi:ADP-ribose pyrophosphatase YjhB (NUDIX family)
MKIIRPKSQQPIPSHAKKVFSGILVDVYHWEQEQFDGTFKTFEKIKRKFDTVTVVPIMEDGTIAITHQEQPGMVPFIGFPGGIIDAGEEPLAAAKRELHEETGFEAKEFVLWDATQLFAKTDWALYTFIAKGCKKVGDMHLDSGEKISLEFVTFDELLHIAAKKEFRDMEIALKIFQLKENQKELEELRKLFTT